jgi:hypothetical protein
MLHLDLISGPLAGARFDLRDRCIVLGRADGRCDLVVPGDGVSRRHALIERGAQGYRVSDLCSTNGTWLNGLRLPTHGTQALRVGDELCIGACRFRCGEDAEASEVTVRMAPGAYAGGSGDPGPAQRHERHLVVVTALVVLGLIAWLVAPALGHDGMHATDRKPAVDTAATRAAPATATARIWP